MSHNSSFPLKYNIQTAFYHMRSLRGQFAIDQISLQKQQYLDFDLELQYSFEANENTLWAN